MWKYLPRDTDMSSYWDVSTGEPVVIDEGTKHCPHLKTTNFEAMDKRSDNMQVWLGDCCVACGFITRGPVKRD